MLERMAVQHILSHGDGDKRARLRRMSDGEGRNSDTS